MLREEGPAAGLDRWVERAATPVEGVGLRDRGVREAKGRRRARRPRRVCSGVHLCEQIHTLAPECSYAAVSVLNPKP
eukprot:358707-Chlamydomonas_euryale.AAC.1